MRHHQPAACGVTGLRRCSVYRRGRVAAPRLQLTGACLAAALPATRSSAESARDFEACSEHLRLNRRHAELWTPTSYRCALLRTAEVSVQHEYCGACYIKGTRAIRWQFSKLSLEQTIMHSRVGCRSRMQSHPPCVRWRAGVCVSGQQKHCTLTCVASFHIYIWWRQASMPVQGRGRAGRVPAGAAAAQPAGC